MAYASRWLRGHRGVPHDDDPSTYRRRDARLHNRCVHHRPLSDGEGGPRWTR
jgi:hypothetical protein